ncbi:nucleoside triphosphate pyrophosphohydrolase family protein [Micromonospora aurantiaca (nom. illeg.)]|uniref:NTP pyrophosphohydrolase MazG-like domain-containing protein n=1 Tax=Micromonospora aurantiaca (nom. illeg.) TaxID=47850 RepID=A0A6N3JZR2_9ACTN|nr:nucleoside triphosphate pyrophosphohydrolase family protein [Micromonospora aurantiaca]ADL45333.1 MazG nucleotide pyrophosphohydrolase [Micromonospora aurantiaca ATCC 27029]AXH91448.1 hypothetical protein DVH21_16780 [Micromonospora aurantiaca]
MDLAEYQRLSAATAVYPRIGSNYHYPVLGLASEAGEVADVVKRIERDDDGAVTDRTRDAIAGELGDVLWYVAQVASEFGLDLSEIARGNLEKLQGRHDRGTIRGTGAR